MDDCRSNLFLARVEFCRGIEAEGKDASCPCDADPAVRHAVEAVEKVCCCRPALCLADVGLRGFVKTAAEDLSDRVFRGTLAEGCDCRCWLGNIVDGISVSLIPSPFDADMLEKSADV